MPPTALQQVALACFADGGFDGTPLGRIAKRAGIKTPSIYAHFAGKEALFMSLVGPVIERELEGIRRALEKPGKPEAVLFALLADISVRFDATPHLRFLLRICYLPPKDLARSLAKPVRRYMERLDEITIAYFRRLSPARLEPETLALAFRGMADSLQAELLYGGKESYQARQHALWAVFRLAL